jgi:hypothetical protein
MAHQRDPGIDAKVLLALLVAGHFRWPKPGVWELRRRARYAGFRMTRTGVPIRLARRDELRDLLANPPGCRPSNLHCQL